MVNFDWGALSQAQAQSGNLLTAVGKGFGAPTCLTSLVGDALALIPMPTLQGMQDSSEKVQGIIDGWMDSAKTALELDLGVSITVTPNGEISVTSRNSKFGKEAPGSNWLTETAAWVNVLTNEGIKLYQAGVRGYNHFQQVKGCIETYLDGEKFAGTNTANPGGAQSQLSTAQFDQLMQRRFGPRLAELSNIKAARDEWRALQDSIEEEILKRIEDPTLEPELQFPVSGVLFRIAGPSGIPEEEEVIRLVFGPPKAVEGQFVVSRDGLYYDSQSSGVSGVTKVLNYIESKKPSISPADRWKFSFDPNLGGKGVQISSKTVKHYIDTIFDPKIINDRDSLRGYYDADHYLKNLEGQKTKRVYDLSSHVEELKKDGASTAVIENTRQSLYSEISLFTEKINKRKKQIEIAVDIPANYGNTSLFLPGEVPVNDFSYLQQFNFAPEIRKQKALVLDQKDIKGSVLPYTPKFVTSEPNEEFENVEHIFVSDIGKGEILYSNTASSIVAPQLSITDRIVTRGLSVIYNYLDSNVVSPSSTEFNITNCAETKIYNNGQLAGKAASAVFTSGLCVPYLKGITEQVNNHPFYPSGIGSFVRASSSVELQDLTYSKEGFTFETWMHVPYLTDVSNGWGEDSQDTSALYRLVLANENTGIDPGLTAQTNPERLDLDLGDGIVKGMIMGFTRDIRLTKNSDYEDTKWGSESMQNLANSSLAFFVAPTQSINDASVGLIFNGSGCNYSTSPSWYSFTVDASTASPEGNQYLLSASDEYIHVALTTDPSKDNISLYVNGELLSSSSLTCLGRDKYSPLQIPSFRKQSGFNYSGTNVGASASAELRAGPRGDLYFTPWILGGGYTDGIAGTGFMGNHTFGAISGLRGHLGSTKFYTRALDQGEVRMNYNAQKNIFENIETLKTYNLGKYI